MTEEQSTSMELFHIPTEKESKHFLSHINIEENKRIIFSGPFGSGKTTFLHEFFKEYGDYTPIFLRPVNYSISSNKDVLEYIKVDIIYELIKLIPIENIQFSDKELLPGFIAKQIYPILFELTKMIPLVGKPIKNLAIITQNIIQQYKSYKEENNETNFSELNKFISTYTNQEGTIFEKNDVTVTIRNIINKYKIEDRKKMVLVIDDLDRIDPEHIFRILNVFACNADSSFYDELDNKFGFDKIMVVCDISNLRCLFAHKYGGSTDFCGYIDKFYSLNVYHFTLHNDIVDSLPLLITNFNNEHDEKIFFSQQEIIYKIISDLIFNNLVNLRSLHNLNKIELSHYGHTDNDKELLGYDTIYVLYQFLKEIYVTDERINEVLSLMKSTSYLKNKLNNQIDLIAGYFCHMIYYFQTRKRGIEKCKKFCITVQNNIYECEIIDYKSKTCASLINVNKVNSKTIKHLHLYILIEESLTICKELIYCGYRLG